MDSGRIKFLLIVTIFVLPFAISYYLYEKHLSGDKLNTTNYGTFINPIFSLIDTSFYNLSGDLRKYDSLDKNWYLIYLANKNCNKVCKDEIYLLRQVNIALGKDMNRMQRIVLLAESDSDHLGQEMIKQYPNLIVVSSQPSSLNEIFRLEDISHNLFLVDPNGNVILGYDEGFKGKKLLKDIKKLLKLSIIG